jgi:hypothetical protein
MTSDQYYMISMPYDVTDLIISQPNSWHLRGEMARVGGRQTPGAPGVCVRAAAGGGGGMELY